MQSRQAVLPEVEVYLPASHLSHVSRSGVAPYDPGRHAEGDSDPTLQLVPAGQTMHSSLLDITARLAFACVPPGHGSAAAAPSLQ